MASITKYAGTITQTTGGSYATWNDLNYLTNPNVYELVDTVVYISNPAWASISGKNSSPNRPATLTFTNFGFNIPEGSEITKVKVAYTHCKVEDIRVDVTQMSISAPTLTLQGADGFTAKGSAPPSTGDYNNAPYMRFSNTWNTTTLSREQVNSNNFGVKINYPANTGTNNGTIYLADVYITIEYTLSEYSVNIKRATGKYNQAPYEIEANISNLNNTSYNPRLTITAPTGFTFTNGTGTGIFTRVSDRVITWNPYLGRNVGTSTCRLVFDTNVTFPDDDTNYTGNFSIVESLNGTSKSFTATIYHRPSSEGSETTEYTPIITDSSLITLEDIKAVVDDEIPNITTNLWDRCFCFPANGSNEVLLLGENTPVKYYNNGSWVNGTTYSNNDYSCVVCDYEQFKFTEPGRYVLLAYDVIGTSSKYSDYDEATPIAKCYFNIKPVREGLSIPNFTIVSLTSEELNRLGDGYTYIAETYLKHTTTDTYPRDWYTNNRIGVCNVDVGETPSEEDIYSHTTYWSGAVTSVNNYENLECEFTYNEDYPLYLLVTGDMDEADTYGFDKGEISFTEPCIIERNVYNGREPTGTYPVPILSLIGEDTSQASITLAGYQNSTSVRLYDIPLDNDTGYAIRGIEVTGTVDSTDDLTLYAKIITPNGDVGQRSIVLERNSEDFTIGSLGDLWGLGTLTLEAMGGWEIDFSISNLLSNTNSTIQLQDINVVFYVEEIETQSITVKIDGEDLSYYGAFIETVNLPEGLETDTSFLTIDGTDTNDAYRQNIREKTIEIGFNISECDLKTSTDMLRQITKLFVNEKDQYNRPIPKRIEFSYYPEEYFEYIMTAPFTVTNEVSGYDVTAKLTIPAGTSYSKEDTVTNTVGYVQGLAAVNPIITIQPSDETIEINETLSGQSFNIGYTGDWNDKIVEIDCEDRKVYLKTADDDEAPIDISKYVDHNVDWFRLYGEYSFEGANCIIRTVTFNERW